MGAKQFEAPIDCGHGFITASVVDPFGTIQGIMSNPRYLQLLDLVKNAESDLTPTQQK